MKKILSSMLGAAILLLGSCAQEERIGWHGNNEGDIKMTVEIEKLAGTAGAANTRGVENTWSVDGENAISSLYLLFFDPDTKAYINYGEVALPGPTEANPDGGTEMNVDGFAFPDGRSNGAYTILALANVSQNYFIDGSVRDWMSQWNGKDINYVKANAFGRIPLAAIPSNALPMTGEFDKPADETEVHLLLTRSVARLDVTNNLTDKVLVSVSVWNGFPDTSIWGGGIIDYSANTERIRNHYGVNITETKVGEETVRTEKLRGGLYAFENQVKAPEKNDKVSTCLIIGLKAKGTDGQPTGETEYYRANIKDGTGVQNLRRNHVYNLIINAYGGQGKSTEEIAYLGDGNELIYYVGEWSEDTNGLVVTDQYSTMSIPTKTVNMGDSATGSVAEIKVHTFSSLASPAPLQIRSQTYRPALDEHGEPSIEAKFEGNTLIINATPLDIGQDSRSGVIVLSYAGLEIALNVSQSGKHNDYLIVTEPDGGIQPFPPHGGLSSGIINVQASDHWTAKLYMSGFSFDVNTAIDPVKWIWTDPTSNFTDGRGYDNHSGLITFDGETDIDKFRVHTHTANTGSAVREAFIIVQLDKDPENYSALITLSQNFVKKLKYAPWFESHNLGIPTNISTPTGDGWQEEGGTIVFDGLGNLMTGDGYANNTDTYYVQSSLNESSQWIPWYPSIVPTGLNNDREFFSFAEVHDSSNPLLNKITVSVVADPENPIKTMNLTGVDRMVKLRVQTDAQTYAEIPVIQKPVEWHLPATPPAFKADGDSIQLQLDAPQGMHYTVEVESINGAVDHFAYVEDPDEPYQTETEPGVFERIPRTKYSKLLPKPVDEPFIVGFPKLIYPNLGTPASAVIKVTMVESGQSKTFTILQMPPAQQWVNILNLSVSWGRLSDTGENSSYTANWLGSYNEGYVRSLKSSSNFGPTGTVKTLGPLRLASANPYDYLINTAWPAVKSTVTYVHLTDNYNMGVMGSDNVQGTIWNWATGGPGYEGNEGFLHIQAEVTGSGENTNQTGPTKILGKMGLQTRGLDHAHYGLSTADNRIMKWVKGGEGPFGAEETRTTWTTDGNTSHVRIASISNEGISTSLISDFIYPVLVHKADGPAAPMHGSTPPADFKVGEYSSLVIDAKRRIIVMGDSEMFQNDETNLTSESNGNEITNAVKNIQAWGVNAAQWGSHFGDYFWNSPRYMMPKPQPQE